MVHTIVDGTFRQTNLTNDSSEYLARREELRLAEIELMRQRERVAELRRHLPQGAPIEDYSFAEGPRDLRSPEETQDIVAVRTTHLSELFTKPNRSLIIYHLKYGKRQTKPCPMCTAWLDGVNGVAHRLAQKSRLRPGGRRRRADSPRSRACSRLGQAEPPQRRPQHL